MIKVHLWYTKDGHMKSYAVMGHSGIAPQGKDILCAAVSGGVQAITVGMLKVAGKQATFKKKKGFLYCAVPERIAKRAEIAALTDALEAFITELAGQYKNNIDVVRRKV